jgi:hypothetical protein
MLDLHGEPSEARRRPLVLVGSASTGRLLVTALDHDATAAGRWLLAAFAHLLTNPNLDTPPITLTPQARTVLLPGPWRMQTAGHEVMTGTARVNKGRNVFEGWETFHGNVHVPLPWRDHRILLRAESVGDAYEIHVDGNRLLLAGHETGVQNGMRDRPQTFDVTGRLHPGTTHALTFRIRDWRGAGGLIGPVYLTTEDPEARLTY